MRGRGFKLGSSTTSGYGDRKNKAREDGAFKMIPDRAFACGRYVESLRGAPSRVSVPEYERSHFVGLCRHLLARYVSIDASPVLREPGGVSLVRLPIQSPRSSFARRQTPNRFGAQNPHVTSNCIAAPNTNALMFRRSAEGTSAWYQR